MKDKKKFEERMRIYEYSKYSKSEHDKNGIKYNDPINEGNVVLNEEYYGGHLKKSFVRLNDNTDSFAKKVERKEATQSEKTSRNSLFFGELIRSLKSGKSSYKTYFNDLIVGKKSKDIYVPENVSCMVKDMDGVSLQFLYSECIGCRLANALGIDAVYNVAHEKEIVPDEDGYIPEYDYPEYDYLISVDAVPSGYKSDCMAELNMNFNEDSSLAFIFDKIDKNLPLQCEKRGHTLTSQELYDFKRKFCDQYLFRQLICEDLDFIGDNTMVLISDDGKIEMGPCIDMELLFRGSRSVSYYTNGAMEEIDFLKKNYPEFIDSFMARLENAHKSQVISDIMENGLKVNPYFAGEPIRIINRNVTKLLSLYKAYEKEIESTNNM